MSSKTIAVLLAALACISAAPASAQLSAYYKGTVVEEGKTYDATARYSIEKGRAAFIMTGAKSNRMLFNEKDQVLHLVNDSDHSYFDMTKDMMKDMTGGMNDMNAMMEDAKKQMKNMTPEQQAMAEKMMGQMMAGKGAPAAAEPETYVRSNDEKEIAGYKCRRVDVMRGEEKRAEYWGTKNKDFEMSKDERATMLAMQDYLRNFTIHVTPASSEGGSSRAFNFDTAVDGYPVITRCFKDGKPTLDLLLTAHDHAAIPDSIFEVPSGYQKMDMQSMAAPKPHKGNWKPRPLPVEKPVDQPGK
jgi:hypothetical protein